MRSSGYKTVNDLDELGLIGAIRSLEQGADLAGLELNGTPSFIVGCTMAQWADEPALDRELEATRKKVEAGAGFVVTPAVYDLTSSGRSWAGPGIWKCPSSPP